MAYTSPTRSTLIERITADLESNAAWTYPRQKWSPWYHVARVMAGVTWGIYKLGEYIADQILPDSAEVDYLERHASLYGLSRTAATKATGTLDLTGTNGSVVPTGTTYIRADGVVYVTTASATISSGVATVTVKAVEGGTDGNLAAAQTMTIGVAISGIDGTATVHTGGITGGTDAESDASLRARVLARIADPPQGGASSDYVAWAQAALSTVENVWVTTGGSGPGTVTVWFSVEGNDPIPDSGDVSTVQAYIDARSPVTADVTVAAPVAEEIDLTIALTIQTGYTLADVKADIQSELRALFASFDDVDTGGTVYLSQIIGAISAAPGEDHHTLTLPAANVTIPLGSVPTLGTITWS